MRTTITALLSLLTVAAAFAQWEPPNAPRVPDDGGEPRVYFVHSYFAETPNVAGLDARLSVHVQNFAGLLKDAGGNCSNIVLFINGMPIKGLKPESCEQKRGHVRYLLRRTEDSDEVWRKILGSPHHYLKPVSISLGHDPQFSIASSVDNFDFEVIPRGPFFLFIGLTILFALFVVILARRTGIIRSGSLPVAQRPYSLSLFQMAFWFFLVIVAYVFMWLINDELDSITESVLALIGIGAATAIGATLIDKSKAAPAPEMPGGKSRGFIRDVLSDADGSVSLHRFQMFAWTLVLGVIFIASVYKNLAMPQFSTTLLGLMGISSGTYLGFKVPEKAATDAPAGTTP